eukprot:1451952-Amphidinium_carterae.8
MVSISLMTLSLNQLSFTIMTWQISNADWVILRLIASIFAQSCVVFADAELATDPTVDDA